MFFALVQGVPGWGGYDSRLDKMVRVRVSRGGERWFRTTISELRTLDYRFMGLDGVYIHFKVPQLPESPDNAVRKHDEGTKGEK